MAKTEKVETQHTQSDPWEDLKARGFEVDSITLWTATELFNRAEKTISQAKFPGAKFWWTPSGCLMEFKNKRELIPQAGIAKVKCF